MPYFSWYCSSTDKLLLLYFFYVHLWWNCRLAKLTVVYWETTIQLTGVLKDSEKLCHRWHRHTLLLPVPGLMRWRRPLRQYFSCPMDEAEFLCFLLVITRLVCLPNGGQETIVRESTLLMSMIQAHLCQNLKNKLVWQKNIFLKHFFIRLGCMKCMYGTYVMWFLRNNIAYKFFLVLKS